MKDNLADFNSPPAETQVGSGSGLPKDAWVSCDRLFRVGSVCASKAASPT
jgi:hypothetical protein